MIKLLLYKCAYVKRDFIKKQLEYVQSDIRDEIERRKGFPNIGKIGCMKRIQKVIDLL